MKKNKWFYVFLTKGRLRFKLFMALCLSFLRFPFFRSSFCQYLLNKFKIHQTSLKFLFYKFLVVLFFIITISFIGYFLPPYPSSICVQTQNEIAHVEPFFGGLVVLIVSCIIVLTAKVLSSIKIKAK